MKSKLIFSFLLIASLNTSSTQAMNSSITRPVTSPSHLNKATGYGDFVALALVLHCIGELRLVFTGETTVIEDVITALIAYCE